MIRVFVCIWYFISVVNVIVSWEVMINLCCFVFRGLVIWFGIEIVKLVLGFIWEENGLRNLVK